MEEDVIHMLCAGHSLGNLAAGFGEYGVTGRQAVEEGHTVRSKRRLSYIVCEQKHCPSSDSINVIKQYIWQ